MTGERHCDLCDLPFAQCAHGLARRQRRAETKAKAKAKAKKAQQKSLKGQPPKPASRRLLSQKQREQLPEVLHGLSVVAAPPAAPKTRRKCVTCGRKARFGRYNVCATCLRAEGGRECTRCGRLFRPPAGSKAAKRCGTCSGKGAYTITTMGAPGSGKRA